jgi:hypothetical protein
MIEEARQKSGQAKTNFARREAWLGMTQGLEAQARDRINEAFKHWMSVKYRTDITILGANAYPEYMKEFLKDYESVYLDPTLKEIGERKKKEMQALTKAEEEAARRRKQIEEKQRQEKEEQEQRQRGLDIMYNMIDRGRSEMIPSYNYWAEEYNAIYGEYYRRPYSDRWEKPPGRIQPRPSGPSVPPPPPPPAGP